MEWRGKGLADTTSEMPSNRNVLEEAACEGKWDQASAAYAGEFTQEHDGERAPTSGKGSFAWKCEQGRPFESFSSVHTHADF